MAAAEKRAGADVRAGRVVIEGVTPEIDCGRFPIKRVVGEGVTVEADVMIEGHETLACAVLYRRKGAPRWTGVPMVPLSNDRWRGTFPVTETGRYQYTVMAWPQPFARWQKDLATRLDAGQDIAVDLLIGAELVEATAATAARTADRLRAYALRLRSSDRGEACTAALAPELGALMSAEADRARASFYGRELDVVVEPVRGAFSAWYELFPRSASREPETHGTFRDVVSWLPRLSELGFDVLYLPPIHPIGTTFRKGRNNALTALETDPGSPWAIGSAEGGHKHVHQQLGTLADFQELVRVARDSGIGIALDIAFQASPDHPYVRTHPEWFRRRPDGTIQYAENPPKKYQDIYPFDFDSGAADALWQELLGVFLFWIEQGVRIFRVDNPHTKPFPFWEWVITELKERHPDVLLLSEAFTRPKVMYRLAKLGFSQSYTYFAWRNTKAQLIEYFQELSSAPIIDFFRPNLWPNTPDILTEPFQQFGEPVFKSRFILAATLGASYGIYGPPYEALVHAPRESGSEEYLDSEKYQIRHWDVSAPTEMSRLIARVNRIRRENPALHTLRSLRFHRIDNEQMIAYSKQSADRANLIVTIVNLDPHWRQGANLELPLESFGLSPHEPYLAHDLLTDARYPWQGPWNYVELDPKLPAHILRLERAGSTP